MWRKLLIKKMRPFKTFSYKNCEQTFLKNIKEVVKKV